MATTLRSSVRNAVWPAIVTGRGATLLSTAFQLELSQWWPAPMIEAQQRRQLAALLAHARETVPFYKKRFEDAGLTDQEALTPEGWLRIPLLTRQDIRSQKADLASTAVPSECGRIRKHKTSGSTGEPLEVLGTEIEGLFWESLAFRHDLWHRRDFDGRLVVIRSGRYQPDPLAVHDYAGWGVPSVLHQTGPMTLFYHAMPLPRQVEVLEARSPHYILMYPSNARALCRYSRRRPVRLPNLKAVHTYGEPLTPDVRRACRETWGVPVQDVYSCEEMGLIALQCPEHEHYHVQSETVRVEILDDDGRPTAPGRIGHVVLTPLHHFAMPLIRYAIGDFAEVGEPCSCGRGLPVIKRFPGRRRSRVALPDGTRIWPNIGELWGAIPDADQIQVIQRGEEQVDVRFARLTDLSPAEEQAVTERIQRALDHSFRLTFIREDAIAHGPNGKYETFYDAR